VLLPRNHKQKVEIAQQWPHWLQNRKVMIPGRALDGLNLIWHSDLVISGGGTMNREAAALRVPVYSIFRGTIGAVDQYLSQSGRLTLLETIEDVRKISLAKTSRSGDAGGRDTSALKTIVDGIMTALHNDWTVSDLNHSAMRH
jgi:predicted glycosyltransferase